MTELFRQRGDRAAEFRQYVQDSTDLHTTAPDSESRGRLRTIKTKLAAEFGAFMKGVEKLSDTTAPSDLMLKKGTGRKRALARVVAATRAGKLERTHGRKGHAFFAFSILHPRDAILAPNPRLSPGESASRDQSTISVDYLSIGDIGGGPGIETGSWGLDVTDHASSRYLQRGDDNLESAIWQAFRALMAAPAITAAKDGDLFVPAGDGVFIGQLIFTQDESDGNPGMLFRCETWIHEDMRGENQVPLAAARRGELLLGDTWLAPHCHRMIIDHGAKGIECVPSRDWVAAGSASDHVPLLGPLPDPNAWV